MRNRRMKCNKNYKLKESLRLTLNWFQYQQLYLPGCRAKEGDIYN